VTKGTFAPKLDRRSVIKAAAAAGVAQLAPYVLTARAADTVKIGLDNPLTGTFAALGKNELIGARLAIDQINATGGILGRQVDLLVEDSTSGDTATAVQKALKLIDRGKVDFLIGNINSALAQAMANTSFQKGVFHIVPGGHTDTVTGTQCHWNVFRVCNTTRMETNSVAKLLLSGYGKKWYFITTDYAFGHSLQKGFEASLEAAAGTELGADFTPLGTTDFSANLIKAQSTSPDAIILLLAGDDMINCLKQAVQFGLEKKFHIAGAQQELEVNIGLAPDALFGDWVFEWYWKQPGVPHVSEFVADIRKRSGGKVPTARTWFGYAAVWSVRDLFIQFVAAARHEGISILLVAQNVRSAVEIATAATSSTTAAWSLPATPTPAGRSHFGAGFMAIAHNFMPIIAPNRDRRAPLNLGGRRPRSGRGCGAAGDRGMTNFAADALHELRDVGEVRIRTETHPRTAPIIWVVVAGDEVFVRSWRGAEGRWYRDLAAGGHATLEFAGRRLAVQAIPTNDTDAVARASREFLTKYRRSPHAREMVRSDILSTTLRLEPR
jgi:branched-chain amino acid transport system substrate-binding protein